MEKFRLATYRSSGQPRAALIVGNELYDAQKATGEAAYIATLAILEDWDRAQRVIGDALSHAQTGVHVSQVELLPPLLYPGTIYCAGANYQAHMDAVAKHRGLPPQPSPKSVGVGPFFFLKTPRSVVGTGTEIVSESPALDFEIELAVVIGRRARSVSAADALQYVAGYTVANDLSARDRIMRAKVPESSPFRFDWNSHKNFDGSCPLGPWIVPAANDLDPQALTLKTWINQELRQDSTTHEMIFSVAEQIEALSAGNTLYPGDVILTGTPAGVGAESSTWLKHGDTIRMEIGGIGEITSRIASRQRVHPNAIAHV